MLRHCLEISDFDFRLHVQLYITIFSLIIYNIFEVGVRSIHQACSLDEQVLRWRVRGHSNLVLFVRVREMVMFSFQILQI